MNDANITIINNGVEFECKKVGQMEGFESPTVRSVFVDPPSRPGSLYINSLAGRRNLSWQAIIEENVQENRRLLAAVCTPGNLKTIQFRTCDGVEIQTEVEVLTLLMPYREGKCIYLIQAVSPDAYFEGQTLHSEQTGITVLAGGMAIPAPIPAPIGGGSSLSFVLDNDGNTNAKPIFTIRGPGANFLIQNIDTGEKIELNLTLLANETVVINTKTNRVYQGSENVYGRITRTPSGNWVSLRPGTNRIVFNAGSGTSTNTRLTVDWRDTYGGI